MKIFTTVKSGFDFFFQMLDFVACLPPSGGHGSKNGEYLIDSFKAVVENSYNVIGVFEICNVFHPKARFSISGEVRPFSVVSKKDESFQFLNLQATEQCK